MDMLITLISIHYVDQNITMYPHEYVQLYFVKQNLKRLEKNHLKHFTISKKIACYWKAHQERISFNHGIDWWRVKITSNERSMLSIPTITPVVMKKSMNFSFLLGRNYGLIYFSFLCSKFVLLRVSLLNYKHSASPVSLLESFITKENCIFISTYVSVPQLPYVP